MSQSNFELLVLPNEHNEDSSDAHVDDVVDRQKVEREETECEGNTWKETYVPVNFISDEVYNLIAAWEASSLATSSDIMDLDVSSLPLVPASQNNFEPTRRFDDVSPPKRFYRTFWSSVSKRIIASSEARQSRMFPVANINIKEQHQAPA
jgi:hypothetical protein